MRVHRRGFLKTAGLVALTFVAAGVQQSGFDRHRHLNHNDLQHLVQMVAVWFLDKGGTHLVDTPV